MNILRAVTGLTALHLFAACGGELSTVESNSNASVGVELQAVRVAARQLRPGAGAVSHEQRWPNLRPHLHTDHYFIHYGDITQNVIETAKRYQVAILHPQWPSLTRTVVAQIQEGPDPSDPGDDVKVLLYVSVGEDLRTVRYTDAQMLADPRFAGDGSGPRVDPRGVHPDGLADLSGVRPLGDPSPGGTGFASFYLDDNDLANGTADGLPDRNRHFGAAFVNAGDPAWFEVVDNMTMDGVDGLAGFREAMTLDFGRGLGADGVFLDTIDTAAPNFYTDDTSPNQGEFEWTAPGFADFILRLKRTYPDKLVLQNRGLFFYDPRLAHYRHNPGSAVDFLLFESYRLNSNTFESYNPFYFADNKHNFMPKLAAEAGRPDGFRVLSLGYAQGPDIALATLNGGSSAGEQTLLADIDEAQRVAGFRHYIASAGLDLENDFVLERGDLADTSPPVWSSTYNDNARGWPEQSDAPTPRVGLQQAIAESGAVRLRWDVALDMHRVAYVAYYQEAPFDFASNRPLASATRVPLQVGRPSSYGRGPLSANYPYEAVVDGLRGDRTYYFLLRAVDTLGNEDGNEQTIAVELPDTPQIDGVFADWAMVQAAYQDGDDADDSAGPDFIDVKLHTTETALYLYFSSDNPFNLDGSPTYGYSRTLIFLDTDMDGGTGYSVGGALGSELLIAGNGAYGQAAGAFNTGYLGGVQAAQSEDRLRTEMQIPIELLGDRRAVRVVLLNDESGDYAPDYGGYLEVVMPLPGACAADDGGRICRLSW